MDDSDNENDNSNDTNSLDDMERASKAIEERALEDEELSKQELLTNIESKSTFTLPSGQEIEEKSLTEDLTIISERINEIRKILDNFSELREEGKSRSDYVERLIQDLAIYYGYNQYLAEKLFHLFPIGEVSPLSFFSFLSFPLFEVFEFCEILISFFFVHTPSS